MTKTILIPTDFSVKSLNLVKEAMKNMEGGKINLILVHGIDPPDSITELLFFSKSKLINSLESEEYKASCKFIQSKYLSKITSVCLDIFTGANQAAFENYLVGNKIDEAYIPKNFKLKNKHCRSFDILPYFRKSKIKVHEIDWINSVETQEEDQIAEIFFTQNLEGLSKL